MDSAIVEMVIVELQQKNKEIELFSKEYFFDEMHAKHRSEVALWGGPLKHRTRLSLLMREGMTDERRASLFPGTYDLGNMKSILPQFCKLSADTSVELTLSKELEAELLLEKKLHADLILDRSTFKKIKKDIAGLTGRKMEHHYAHNKSTALKVIKLLYRINKDRMPKKSDGSSKKPQLFALLQWPKQTKGEEKREYSLSFRAAYPYAKNTDQVWLIADLKTYLSAELDQHTYENIGALQYFLEERLNNTVHNVQNALSHLSYLDQIKAYQLLVDTVNHFKVEPTLAGISLDEELYFYLNALEFTHFAFGYSDLLKKAVSDCDVVPGFVSTERLAKDSVQNERFGMHDRVIPLYEIADSMQLQMESLCILVSSALRKVIAAPVLKEATKYVPNLLSTHAMFGEQGRNGNMSVPLFSGLECVAAICCICDELVKKEKERTKHQPYWKGQAAQGGSLLTSLETAPEDQNWRKDPVPEEHRQIWIHRLEWFLAALQGQAKLKTQQFAFRSAVAAKMAKISETNNLACVHNNLSKLSSRLEELINSSF